MVRNNTSLKQAALDLGVSLDPDEAERIGRRKEFQEILRAESNKYFSAVANDPTRTKSSVLGRMWVQAERLEAEGEHEKAAAVLDRICKAEGWTGADSSINVFSGLTARDIKEAKDRLMQIGERGKNSGKELPN